MEVTRTLARYIVNARSEDVPNDVNATVRSSGWAAPSVRIGTKRWIAR
jgi:hypothetical protein